MDQVNFNTIKFTGENWSTWKFQTRILLQSKGLYQITAGEVKKPTENDKDWYEKDAKAQAVIVLRMEEQPLTHILSCTTAAEMWEKLMSIYEKKSQVSIHLLQQKFFALEFKHNEGAAGFISQLEEIKSTLKQLGEDLSEKMVITKILMSLPDNLKHFVSAWESTASDNQTLMELTSRLLIEEERLNKSESTVALMTNKREIKCFSCGRHGHVQKYCRANRDESKGSTRQSTTRKTCNYCKKQGHLLADCWFKKKKENDKSQANETSNAFMSTVGDECESLALIGESDFGNNDWCMDSGASDHICFDAKQFAAIHDTNKVVAMGDGSTIKVTGVGSIKLEAWNGTQWIRSELNHVLYVPQFKINLFSVGKVLDNGYTIRTKKDKSEIIDKHGSIRAVALRHSKFFKMFFRINAQSNTSICNAVGSLNDWHSKLVHVNFDLVKRTLKQHNIAYEGNVNPFCKDCLMGKQHKLSFNKSESSAVEIGQLVHGDLCGPLEIESIGGAKYFLLLKDDYSNFRVVYFLRWCLH
ncbi:hypothetical protein PPYR_13184 [Photinus pyralis]|uniref:CCHC-type domain-containing protein n=1 Tax=Photinus pyralis TaxID=7054 RepID=A0A5N4A8C1_PHOPY|nr:hypothetical protein PPYR_13184 [Photinus pyralis]